MADLDDWIVTSTPTRSAKRLPTRRTNSENCFFQFLFSDPDRPLSGPIVPCPAPSAPIWAHRLLCSPIGPYPASFGLALGMDVHFSAMVLPFDVGLVESTHHHLFKLMADPKWQFVLCLSYSQQVFWGRCDLLPRFEALTAVDENNYRFHEWLRHPSMKTTK